MVQTIIANTIKLIINNVLNPNITNLHKTNAIGVKFASFSTIEQIKAKIQNIIVMLQLYFFNKIQEWYIITIAYISVDPIDPIDILNVVSHINDTNKNILYNLIVWIDMLCTNCMKIYALSIRITCILTKM